MVSGDIIDRWGGGEGGGGGEGRRALWTEFLIMDGVVSAERICTVFGEQSVDCVTGFSRRYDDDKEV